MLPFHAHSQKHSKTLKQSEMRIEHVGTIRPMSLIRRAKQAKRRERSTTTTRATSLKTMNKQARTRNMRARRTKERQRSQNTRVMTRLHKTVRIPRQQIALSLPTEKKTNKDVTTKTPSISSAETIQQTLMKTMHAGAQLTMNIRTTQARRSTLNTKDHLALRKQRISSSTLPFLWDAHRLWEQAL